MSSDTKGRLQWELLFTKKDDRASEIIVDSLDDDDDDNVTWTVTFQGARGTLFEGFAFEGRLHFPNDYPIGAPKLHFIRNIFHPYVCPVTGLYNDEFNWSTMSSASAFLISAHKVLNNPFQHQRAVFNPHAQRLYVADKEIYRKIVEGHLNDEDTIFK